jgi:hypothetical protein
MRHVCIVSDWPANVFVAGTVTFSSITHRLRSDRERDGVYALHLESGSRFYSRAPLRLYDRVRRPLPLGEIASGAKVCVATDDDGWMTAVQVLDVADDCPF